MILTPEQVQKLERLLEWGTAIRMTLDPTSEQVQTFDSVIRECAEIFSPPEPVKGYTDVRIEWTFYPTKDGRQVRVTNVMCLKDGKPCGSRMEGHIPIPFVVQYLENKYEYEQSKH